MNKLFTNFIKILVNLLSIGYIQSKICPSLSTNSNSMFDTGYVIRTFFQIPSTDLLLINTINSSTYSSVVYYNDVSTIQGDIIDIVQSNYLILEMSYMYQEHKILAMNYDRIIVANPYTLKSERSLSMPNLIHATMIAKTKYAVATLKQYVINIIDTELLVVIKSLNNKQFPNVLNTQNFYTKYFTNPSYEWILITVNSYGFYSWSINLEPFETKYNGYIGPTVVNKTDYAYRQFVKHPSKDIYFVGGYNLEILAFEIVDINTQTYRTQMKLNLYESKYKLNVTNIIYKSSTKTSTQPVLIIGDDTYIYDLVLVFDETKKEITIPSYKGPPYINDYATKYLWYENPDETKKQIFLSGLSFVTLYNYDEKTFNYNLFFGNEYKSKRFIYEGNGQFFYTFLRPNSMNYFNKTNLGRFIQKVSFPGGIYDEDNTYYNTFYRVKNCEECLMIKITNLTQYAHSIQFVSMYPKVNSLNYTMNISSIGYKWSDINMNLDPFYYKNQMWVVFGFRNKIQTQKFLFTMINTQNKTQNVNLFAATDEENSRQSGYAVASVDDPDNLEIIGVDQIGQIYVWDFLQPNTIKYSRKSNFSCLNSEIGTVYQYNKNKWLIYVCDDLKVLSYNFEKNITSIIRYVASIPLSLKAYPSAGIITIADTVLGSVYIYKLKNNQFTYFLTIQPGSLKETVISVELLKDNTIWVQYEQSNMFYSLGDCIDDVKDCLSCEFSYNFKILNSNTIGGGTPSNPYQSSFNFLTAMLKSQRYQTRISGINSINVNIIVDPESKDQMILPKEYLNFEFSSIIALTIKSKIENQLALLQYVDNLEFTKYNYVSLQNIKILYRFNQKPNQCGIKFNNITQNATLNNIQLVNSIDQSLNCFQISADQTNLQILKLQITNQDFSNHKYIFSTLYSSWIDIQNLSLDNCILGDSFSILTQNSNLLANVKSVSIKNNICAQDRTNQVSSLFSAGLFHVEDLLIQNNNFCNKIIFSSVPSLEQQNHQFEFKQINILDNTFIAKTSYLFFNSLYSMIQNPSHQVIFQQLIVINNTLQQINEQDLMEASLIQTSKIRKHVFNDITFKNHHQLSFSSIEYSDQVIVNRFNCINDKEYFDSSPNSTLGSCLQLYEVLSTKIQTIRINYKKGYNNKLINLQNKLFYKYSDFDISDGEFSNMLLIQNTINSFANPITINSENILTLIFSNCHFFDNNLEVDKDSQAFSTSAIWIENSQGTVKIIDSTFKNSTSNSIYNFMFIQTSQLELKTLTFENSSFTSDTTQQLGGFMNLRLKALKIIDCSLSKSISQYGSFLYIESLGSLLQIDINNTIFSEGYAEIDGGALYIDIGKSKLEFTCTDCDFDNIYTYNSKSSAIGFQKYRIITQNLIHEMIYKGGNIQSIFGNGDNFFSDIQNMKLSFTDVNFVSETKSLDTSIKQKFGKIASQQSTFVGSEYSEVNIQSCNINSVQILNKDSKLPLLINSDFTSVSFTDTKINDGIFVRSAIKVTNGTLALKNTQFINVSQQKNILSRFLSVYDQTQGNDISSLIIMMDSDMIVSDGTQFIGTKCYNNCTGAVFYLLNTQFDLSNISISDSEAEFGGSVFIQGLKLLNKIISSKFQNNIAQTDGGAIYLQALKNDNFSLKIENCQILSNQAVSGKGGALFIRSNSQNSTDQLIEIQDTQLIGNMAEIGGGIYQKEISPKILGSTTFKQNVGKTFGNDTLSYPTHLRLSSANQFLTKFKAEMIEKDIVIISNFRSGDALTDLSFELVNDKEEIIRPISQQELQDFAVKVQVSKNYYFQNYSIRGNVSTSYDSKKNNQFVFQDFDFIGIPGEQATLEFLSDQIYVLDKSQVNQYNQNYSFKIIINFRNCIQGEAISVYGSLTECIVCQEGKFSFDLNECHTCPVGATCAGGAQMITNQGYWRNTNESTQLISCTLLENCVGGTFDNNVCLEGHIGALCEECDITGVYWNKSYAAAKKNSCVDCDEMIYNSYFVILVTLWTLISMILAIRQDIQAKLEQGAYHTISLRKKLRQKAYSTQKSQLSQQNNQEFVKNPLTKNKTLMESSTINYENDTPNHQSRVKNVSIFSGKAATKSSVLQKQQKKKNSEGEKSSIYIKVLTNYFQIVSSITTFNLNIPDGIFGIPQFAGQPLKITMSSIDCILKEYETTIPFIYMRQMVSFLIPIGYFLIFFFGLGLLWIFKRKGKFPFYILSTATMFLIIYLQPDLVSQLIALASCRKIGDKNYILANVSYECYTNEHLYYVFFFIIPALSIWVLVLPLLLFFMLYKNRSNLCKIKIIMTYGFLYKEYKEKAFYWEFIKMLEKIFIILSLNYYSTTINVKAFLVFTIIVIYGILSLIIEPFEEQHVNSLDNQSTAVCALSVILGLFIYQNPFPYFYFSSLGIIVLINAFFILVLLKKIINVQLKKMENNFRKLAMKIPSLKKFLRQNSQTKKINPQVKENVKKIFQKYLSMNDEEKQKIKIKILKSSFKLTLSNIFGGYGDLDSERNQNSTQCHFVDNNSNDKKFNLLSSGEEYNNLLTQNMNLSPVLRPLYTLEDYERDDEKNQQKRALMRFSVLSQYTQDEKLTQKHFDQEQDEICTQEFKEDGNRRSHSNYYSKKIKFLNSLKNQNINEDLFQVKAKQKNYLSYLNKNQSPSLPQGDMEQANQDEIKTNYDENEDDQQKISIIKFSVSDDSKLENEITPKPNDTEQSEIDTKISQVDLNSYQSKEIKPLHSLNDDITYQGEFQMNVKNEGSKIEDSQIEEQQVKVQNQDSIKYDLNINNMLISSLSAYDYDAVKEDSYKSIQENEKSN